MYQCKSIWNGETNQVEDCTCGRCAEILKKQTMTNKIVKIIVDQIGFVGAEPGKPIEIFQVNGEMASVNWFRKGTEEYNGKYVISVEWENNLKD